MKTTYFLTGALVAVLASSCINIGSGVMGNGEVTTQDRTVTESFTVIEASEGLDVYITQSGEASIRVEADSNVIDLIATDIEDGRLKIHTTQSVGRATKVIHVNVPEVTAIRASSGADVETQNTIRSTALNLDVSSGADLSVMVVASSVDASSSSGGSMKISGEAGSLDADASSGSDLEAGELVAVSVVADASSGAFVRVHATENLNANASSGGDIQYTGEPSVTHNKNMGGNVSRNE